MLWLLTPTLNSIIVTKMIEFVNNKALSDIIVLEANTTTILVNTAIIVVVSLLTCVLPLLKLRKIKPKNIIANKD